MKEPGASVVLHFRVSETMKRQLDEIIQRSVAKQYGDHLRFALREYILMRTGSPSSPLEADADAAPTT